MDLILRESITCTWYVKCLKISVRFSPVQQDLSGKFGCPVPVRSGNSYTLSVRALIQGLWKAKVFLLFLPKSKGASPTDLQHIAKETTSIFQKIHENSGKSNENTMYALLYSIWIHRWKKKHRYYKFHKWYFVTKIVLIYCEKKMF